MALTRKKFLVAKGGSSYGTDATPVGGSNAIQVSSLEVTPIEADNVQAATFQGFLGNSTRGTLVANKRVSVTFEVELAGSGAAGTAPAFGPLLKACGLSETIVSRPVLLMHLLAVALIRSLIYCFYDGTRHVLTGCPWQRLHLTLSLVNLLLPVLISLASTTNPMQHVTERHFYCCQSSCCT
jgi:hypothetical protein